MPKYKRTNITSKIGLNFVRDIVEKSGSIFHEIEQKNDLGIDAIIEFINDEKPTNLSIAVQIKSGDSYFKDKYNYCFIPIEDHYDYWLNYSLPVYGIVYIPKQNKGYRINIKEYLKNNVNSSIIKTECNKTNIFNEEYYSKIFFPYLNNQIPRLELNEALDLFNSKKRIEKSLGMTVLFRQYVNNKIVWQNFLNCILTNNYNNIPYNLIYYLAHIPWHGDISYTGEEIKDEIKNYVKSELNKFDKKIFIKLLILIDENEGIMRGTVGQSIEAIISSINKFDKILEEIMLDNTINKSVRKFSALIYSYHCGRNSLKFLHKIINVDKKFIGGLINCLDECGFIDLY